MLSKNKDENIADALRQIKECLPHACYSDEGISNMSKCATFILDAIDNVRDKTVEVETLTGKPDNLLVIIDEVKYHHNMMMIFASSDVLRYLKGYLSVAVADSKKKALESAEVGTCVRVMDMNIGGNGYGTAVVCYYDSIWFGIKAV